MLKRLHLRNFTVFEDADFEFGSGLNVIVGANGTGKSHVLKAGYAVSAAYFITRQSTEEFAAMEDEIESGFNRQISRIIGDTFQSENVGKLVRYQSLSPTRAEVQVVLGRNAGGRLDFFIAAHTTLSMLGQIQSPLIKSRVEKPVFIPAKEVLTMGWLLPVYDLRKIPIDQTYPDLLRLLAVSPLNLPMPQTLDVQVKLMRLIGGSVEEESGRYFLSGSEQPRVEMNMVAEGVRKFATLYKLLANGTLTPETTLFWDEPEANLNPGLLREMAVVLTELAKAGFQIILATHSLFLLKELHILARQEHKPVRYFGLSAEPGGATTVATADNLELLPDIVALDAELDQSDRFQRVLDQEDADHN